MKAAYPVIFTQGKNVVYIEIPDLGDSGIFSEGYDMPDALDMARDAIGLQCVSMEDNNETFPAPSSLSKMKNKSGEFSDLGPSVLSLVEVDVGEYRRLLQKMEVPA